MDAKRDRPSNLQSADSTADGRSVATFVVGLTIGQLAGAFFLWLWSPTLVEAVLQERSKLYWFLSRSTGIVGYVLLSGVVGTGLLLSTKFARRWPGIQVALDLHRYVSLLSLVMVSLHVFLLLGDRWANYTPKQLVLPFTATQYRPFWVGLGQIGLYSFLLVYGSFWMRRWIGSSGWRRLHYLSYGCWFLSSLHGIFAGTDTPFLVPVYEIAAGFVFFGLVVRAASSLFSRQRSLAAGSSIG